MIWFPWLVCKSESRGQTFALIREDTLHSRRQGASPRSSAVKRCTLGVYMYTQLIRNILSINITNRGPIIVPTPTLYNHLPCWSIQEGWTVTLCSLRPLSRSLRRFLLPSRPPSLKLLNFQQNPPWSKNNYWRVMIVTRSWNKSILAGMLNPGWYKLQQSEHKGRNQKE